MRASSLWLVAVVACTRQPPVPEDQRIGELVARATECKSAECAKSARHDLRGIPWRRANGKLLDNAARLIEGRVQMLDVPPDDSADPPPACDLVIEHLWQMRVADPKYLIPPLVKFDPIALANLRQAEAAKDAHLCNGSPKMLRCIVDATSRAAVDRCKD